MTLTHRWLALFSALGVVYTVSAGTFMRRFFGNIKSTPMCFPAVTIVKPLHGDEWELLENLTSFMDQLPFVAPIYKRDLKTQHYFSGYLKHPYVSL